MTRVSNLPLFTPPERHTRPNPAPAGVQGHDLSLPGGDIRSHFASAEDGARLTGQNAAVLARLRQGPVTSRELVDTIALNYRARISDVRAYLKPRGWLIVKKHLGGGLYEYRLEQAEHPPQYPVHRKSMQATPVFSVEIDSKAPTEGKEMP